MQPVTYFVERDGFVKIGYSANFANRLYHLNKGTSFAEGMTVGPVDVLAVVPCSLDRGDEKRLHARFAKDRLPRSEWFYPSDDLLAHLCSLLDGFCPACERAVRTDPCGEEWCDGLECEDRLCPRCGEECDGLEEFEAPLSREDFADLLPSLCRVPAAV